MPFNHRIVLDLCGLHVHPTETSVLVRHHDESTYSFQGRPAGSKRPYGETHSSISVSCSDNRRRTLRVRMQAVKMSHCANTRCRIFNTPRPSQPTTRNRCSANVAQFNRHDSLYPRSSLTHALTSPRIGNPPRWESFVLNSVHPGLPCSASLPLPQTELNPVPHFRRDQATHALALRDSSAAVGELISHSRVVDIDSQASGHPVLSTSTIAETHNSKRRCGL